MTWTGSTRARDPARTWLPLSDEIIQLCSRNDDAFDALVAALVGRATALGLQLQPSYTPLVFARYAREGREFMRVAAARKRAPEIARRLDAVLAPRNATRAVFLGRIGPERPVKGRSLRLPLQRLVVDAAPDRLG